MNIDFITENIQNNKNKTAVITNNIDYTFGDIYEKYEWCKNYLRNNNISKGSIVAIIADFKPISVALVLALIENDCIIVPVSPTIKNPESFIKISQSEYYVNLSCVGDSVNDIKNNIVFESTRNIVQHPLLVELKGKRHPGLILFSSGTTGEPKAALHDMVMLLEKFKKPGKILRTITFLLFDHIGGFNTMIHTLVNGGTIVTINSRDVDDVCSTIEKYKVELLPTTPTFLNMLLFNKTYEKYDLSSLKVISYGTEPMAESTLRMLHSIYPDLKLKQTYGLSELGIMSTKSESSDSLWLKLGGDGFETKIVDGILFIRAKSAMIGYLNAPSPFDNEGWFNTKDKVEIKGDYLRILGRTTDIINVGGEKVYPIEIENILLKCEGVKDVRVYSEKNMITGNIVVADICVTRENNNREFIKKLRIFCMQNLEKFKVPTRFNLLEDSLYGDRLKKKR